MKTGIKNSCKKKQLYLQYRDSNDTDFKLQYT